MNRALLLSLLFLLAASLTFGGCGSTSVPVAQNGPADAGAGEAMASQSSGSCDGTTTPYCDGSGHLATVCCPAAAHCVPPASYCDLGGGSCVITTTACGVDAGVGANADASVDAACMSSGVIVSNGGTLQPRPTGSALSLEFVYQGTALGITQATGLNQTLPASGGPFEAGTTSGYWAELQDGSGAVLYTQLFQDPTTEEGVGGDGGFTNGTIPMCDPKIISLDLPNDPAGHLVVVYGSPYGTQLVAGELGHFMLP